MTQHPFVNPTTYEDQRRERLQEAIDEYFCFFNEEEPCMLIQDLKKVLNECKRHPLNIVNEIQEIEATLFHLVD